jgi:uncharacterized protein YpmB
MIQIILAIILLVVVSYFVRRVLRQQQLTAKEQELENVEMESDLLDIDKSIAQERAHQREIEKEINNLKKENKP